MIDQLFSIPEEKFSSSRILIADDQPMNLAMVSAVLGEHYKIITATNGEQAIEMALLHLPDLILLDVEMGKISGIEVCKKLKTNEASSDIPILFMTSLESQADEQLCWEVGAVDFIPKPISALTLYHRIKVHLRLKHQSEAMQTLAFIDGLTGVFNRRYIDNQLAIGLKQRRRKESDYSLLMIDVDFFKNFNDMHGHIEGDNCLKKVAKTIAQVASRPLDVVGRYGGEEFAVLLPETDSEGAYDLAAKIVAKVHQQKIPHPGSPFGVVTISLGTVTGSGIRAIAPAELIKAADVALYNAKSSGRNKVQIAELLCTA